MPPTTHQGDANHVQLSILAFLTPHNTRGGSRSILGVLADENSNAL
jgi:hypothetical protein